MSSTPKRLFILDANALLHRAWHALPPLTSPEGVVVNAVYGVMMIVMNLLQKEQPEAMVACWDTEVATFRHEAYKEYKAHRAEQPDELYAQIPLIQQGLATIGVDSLELDGYEADDLLGTIAVRAKKAGWEVVIVTGDRDALQLVQPGIRVMSFKKGVSDTFIYDEAAVKEQYGLSPAQFLEYKAMRGDSSDNIPGVKGIGEKGATDLLQRFGTLEGIFKAAHEAGSELSKSTREKLLAAEAEMPAIMKLVTIVTDVPIAWELHGLKRDEEALRAFLRSMGFKTLLGKMEREGGARGVVSSEGAGQETEKETPSFHNKAVGSPISVEIQRLNDSKEVLNVLKNLHQEKEILVHVARGVQGSLFGEAIESVVLGVRGDKHTLFEFPSTLLRNEQSAKDGLQELFDSRTILFFSHDTKLQLRGLHLLGLELERWGFDSMLGAYLLGAGERNHDLLSVAEKFLQMTLATDAAPLKQAEAALLLIEPVRTALIAENLENVLGRFELPLVPVLARMEEMGIKMDSDYLKELAKEFTADKQRLEKEMIEMAGRAFNPASPSQLADVLFTDLALPTKGIKKGKTGYSTAAPELEKLRGQHPIIEKIEDYREVSKLLSTYVEVLPLLADGKGRVHTTYNQAVAATGRLSSTDPNLQNIPIRTEAGRRIRRAFIAEEGNVLVSCDYSQIELRLAAALSKDPVMTEAFLHGEDIHRATAARIWGIKLNEVTGEQRRAAKAINFGILYGQGAHGLSVTAGISYADAKVFIEKYFQVYAKFRAYIEETKALARTLGYVETLFGRKRPTPEILSSIPMLRAQAERMAVNMPLQGTAADLMKLAMIEVDKKLSTVCAEARMLLQVHDEVVLEVPAKDAKRVAQFVKETMENVEKVGVPIVVEMKIGENWEEME
jgi:DNA polymerase-1